MKWIVEFEESDGGMIYEFEPDFHDGEGLPRDKGMILTIKGGDDDGKIERAESESDDWWQVEMEIAHWYPHAREITRV